ncbi:MAG: hypothetical protein ISN64_00115 [Rickettsia sp.]|nr:hypothetical protein [Rickettsia sp.]
MFYIEENRLLEVNPELAYNVVLNVDQYHVFLPWCIDSKIIKNIDSSQFLADLTINFKGIKHNFRSVVSSKQDTDKFTITSKSSHSIFSTLETNWNIYKNGKNTNISCSVIIMFRSNIFSFMFRLFKNALKKNIMDSFINRIMLLKRQELNILS